MNKIELGGGKIVREGWTNLDLWVHGYDILKTHLSEIPDNSVQRYYSNHTFEHIPLRSLPIIFKNIFRSLEPNGYFRIGIPSVERVVKQHMMGEICPTPVKVNGKIFIAYEHESHTAFNTYEEAHAAVLKVIGGWDSTDLFNGVPEKEFNQFWHYSFLDKYVLYYILWNVGFRKIKFCECGESEIDEFKTGFDHSANMTDFVEVQKVEKFDGKVVQYS